MRDHLGNELLSKTQAFARGIYLLEDCEGTFHWDITATGLDYTCDFNSIAACFGTYGLRMITRTTTPTANDYVKVKRHFGIPPAGLLVVRTKVTSPDWAHVQDVILRLDDEDGATSQSGIFRFTPATPACTYFDDTGGYTTLPGMDLVFSNGTWLNFAMAIDCIEKEYIWCEIAGVHVDLPGIPLYLWGAATTSEIGFSLTVMSNGTDQATLYADAISATEYEEL